MNINQYKIRIKDALNASLQAMDDALPAMVHSLPCLDALQALMNGMKCRIHPIQALDCCNYCRQAIQEFRDALQDALDDASGPDALQALDALPALQDALQALDDTCREYLQELDESEYRRKMGIIQAFLPECRPDDDESLDCCREWMDALSDDESLPALMPKQFPAMMEFLQGRMQRMQACLNSSLDGLMEVTLQEWDSSIASFRNSLIYKLDDALDDALDAGFITMDEYRNQDYFVSSDALPDYWLIIPISINRDSEILSESNWESFIAGLDALDADYCRLDCNHWACGWIAYIAINPACLQGLEYSIECINALSEYPVLDESDFSEREYNASLESLESDIAGLIPDALDASDIASELYSMLWESGQSTMHYDSSGLYYWDESTVRQALDELGILQEYSLQGILQALDALPALMEWIQAGNPCNAAFYASLDALSDAFNDACRDCIIESIQGNDEFLEYLDDDSDDALDAYIAGIIPGPAWINELQDALQALDASRASGRDALMPALESFPDSWMPVWMMQAWNHSLPACPVESI